MKRFLKIISLFLTLFNLSFLSANETHQPVLSFGIVPQQSASRLALLWTPIIKAIGKQANVTIKFKTAPDIPTFEKRLAAGEYDLSYMNPYHYTVFSQNPGYVAFAKAKDKKIKGIIVVAKRGNVSDLKQLAGQTLAFPSPAAFAASILTQAQFSQEDIKIFPKYVSSHDSVYQTIVKGIYPAGGGVMRTFKNIKPEIRGKLKILWTTKGYTPHAFAAHPRLSPELMYNIKTAMLLLGNSKQGKNLFKSINLKGISSAKNDDWDDVRALEINLLNQLAQ